MHQTIIINKYLMITINVVWCINNMRSALTYVKNIFTFFSCFFFFFLLCPKYVSLHLPIRIVIYPFIVYFSRLINNQIILSLVFLCLLYVFQFLFSIHLIVCEWIFFHIKGGAYKAIIAYLNKQTSEQQHSNELK